MVNHIVKESVLDHVYVKDHYQVKLIEYVWPIFGDHAAVAFSIEQELEDPEKVLRRDWRAYSPELLCEELSLLL